MSDTLNVRDYLRSQGFTVGERGRFSAEMIEVAKAAGYLDENGKTPKAAKPAKAVDASPKAPRATSRPQPKAEPQRVVRTPGNTKFVATSGNIRLVHDLCFECKQHAKHCTHEQPVPPKGFVAVEGRTQGFV